MQTFQTIYLTIKSKLKSNWIVCRISLLHVFNIIHLLKSPSLDVSVKKVESWRTVMALEVNLQSFMEVFKVSKSSVNYWTGVPETILMRIPPQHSTTWSMTSVRNRKSPSFLQVKKSFLRVTLLVKGRILTKCVKYLTKWTTMRYWIWVKYAPEAIMVKFAFLSTLTPFKGTASRFLSLLPGSRVSHCILGTELCAWQKVL